MRFEYIQRVPDSRRTRASPTGNWPPAFEIGAFNYDPRFRSDWWSGPPRHSDVSVEVWHGDEEVARLKLAHGSPLAHYYAKPEMFDPLKIVTIEVVPEWQRRGVGAAIISSLANVFSDRTFVAMSMESAEPFWESLGWTRCLQKQQPSFPFYIQPAPGFGRG